MTGTAVRVVYIRDLTEYIKQLLPNGREMA
jgi:hypothetical protein